MSRDTPVRGVTGGNPAGLPVGGVGAGCIEFGRDGLFRNLTINNNRLAHERIAKAPGAFFAVRAEAGGTAAARILQPESDLNFSGAGIEAPFTPEERFQWGALYPEARYELEQQAFPLTVGWRVLAPVLPYDTEAAMLPMAIAVVSVTNPLNETVRAAAMMTWENLCGCSGAGDWPAERGATRFLARTAAGGAEERVHGPQEGESLIPLGLTFGGGRVPEANSDGVYTLCAAPHKDGEVSWVSFDKTDGEQVREMWTAFRDSGYLSNRIRTQSTAHSGAVAHSREIEPGEQVEFVFLLTWYCPVYELGGESIGNGYTNHYNDAVDVAFYGLKHYEYFMRAVREWRMRMLNSSLPAWYTHMLLNSAAPLSTNTILTRDNRFFMLESPAESALSPIGLSFYSSFGLQLFYPSFADLELRCLSEPVDGWGPRPAESLGVVDGDSAPEGPEYVDAIPKYVLMVYRNYALAGRLATLKELYPRVRDVVLYGLRTDHDGDRIPDGGGRRDSFDGGALHGASSYTAGLWLVALRAFARMAETFRQRDDAAHAEKILAVAREQFERKLWNEQTEYYHRCESPGAADAPGAWDGCHGAQLAGPWYGAFLQFDGIFDDERVGRAFASASARLETPRGPRLEATAEPNAPGANECLPNLQAAFMTSEGFYADQADAGFALLQRLQETLHRPRTHIFNQPRGWDLARQCPSGRAFDRHAGSLSLWHSLYAIEGLFLNVPAEELTIMPRLPEGTNLLRAPAFTPVCIGQLAYRLDSENRRVQVTVSFESPIRIRRLRLRAPSAWGGVAVHMVADSALGEARCQMTPKGAWLLVTIELQTTILVHGEIRVTLQAKTGVATTPAGMGQRIAEG